jgi:putative addiction module component (TIGR02574 family)
MTRQALDLDSLRRLPVAERLQLVEDLWDSIAVETPAPDVPLTPTLVAELDRRLKDLDEGRERTFNWEEVRERILKDKLHGP